MVMSGLRAADPDGQFFVDHPDRYAHIRLPRKVPAITRQRAVRMVDECEGEFWSLGAHDKSRRRIILWRVPPTNALYNPADPQILKIPFLLFADETVEDRDDILLPIVQELMERALVEHAR
jgi:hypothetical protein